MDDLAENVVQMTSFINEACIVNKSGDICVTRQGRTQGYKGIYIPKLAKIGLTN